MTAIITSILELEKLRLEEDIRLPHRKQQQQSKNQNQVYAILKSSSIIFIYYCCVCKCGCAHAMVCVCVAGGERRWITIGNCFLLPFHTKLQRLSPCQHAYWVSTYTH